MKAEVFLDTAYAIALASRNDQLHHVALNLADELQLAKTRLITTRAIMMEIGNALSKQRFRSTAVRLLQSLDNDPNVEIIPFSDQLYIKAYTLFCERPDKEWGLIDCVSFIVMKELAITEALTNDDHYRQAGFRVLMRER